VNVAQPILVGWSGGKDSAAALERLRADPAWDVVGLVTTVTGGHDRVSIHGVRRSLLAAQAAAVGLPVREAVLPPAPSNAVYEAVFAATVRDWMRELPEVRHMAFGDLFLADIRAYRERQLEQLGLQAVFPLWGEPTATLARQLIARGCRATLVCVDLSRLPVSLAGRAWDDALLDELAETVDPCGENGEFHTFVTGGPGFRHPVACEPGEVVIRDGFAWADLRAPAAAGAPQ